MSPKKGFKLKERYFAIEEPKILKGMHLFRYAGTFFGAWSLEGCFLLVDNVFLDTGNPNSSTGGFKSFLKELDRERPWMILNTHLHEDHCGKNRLVQSVLKAKIYSPERVKNFSFVSPLMKLIWGKPKKFKYKDMDREVYETDRGRTIEVIPTPGHSPGHVAFRIMPDDVIYTGDAIPLPIKKRYVTAGEDYITEMESLKKLRPYAEGGSTFVSAHHGIVKNSLKLIDDRIAGMSAVVEKVRHQVSLGVTDETEIGLKVFGKPDFIYDKLGNSLRCREDWTIRSIIDKETDKNDESNNTA